jgi:hypothetical protein
VNPETLLRDHAAKALLEIERLDVEIEVTRERWKNEERAYSKMVEDRKRYVAEHEAYKRVLLALESYARQRRL